MASARILCLAPRWLGDAVLSLPAVSLLRDAGAQVDVLAASGMRRVYTDTLAAAQVHEAGSRWQRWRRAWQLRGRRYDAAVILPPSFSAALAAWATGAAVRVGESRDARRLLLTRRLPPASRQVHLARTYELLASTALAALGGQPRTDLGHGTPRLQAQAAERQAAAALLRGRGIRESYLVVAPGARYGPAKRYPAARFAAAAAHLGRTLQAGVVLVGGEVDRGPTAAVRQQLGHAVDLAGQTSLAALVGILAGARGVLCNDSGVMHLAAALGTPVVAVFGSTHPGWTAPLGAHARWVQHPVDCAPCFRKRCPIDFPCMLGLEPQRLVDAMLDLLQPGGPGRPAKPARL